MGSMSVSDLSEVYGGPVEHSPTFFHVFEKILQKYADEPAVIVTHQDSSTLAALTGNKNRPATPCLSWTYRELHQASTQFIGRLAEDYNVRAGDNIVTFIPNGIAWPLVVWASYVGKYTWTSHDFNMVSPPRARELRNVIGRVSPDVVLVADSEGAIAVDNALSSVPDTQPKVKIVLDNNQDTPAGWVTLTSFANPMISDATRTQIEQSAKDDDPERVCNIMFTSGTTSGVPKGCPRTVASGISMMEGYHLGPTQDHRSRNAITTQNFRAIAPLLASHTFTRGGTLIIPGSGFSPSALLQAIETQRVTYMIFVPAMVHALVAHPNFEKTDKSSVETIGMGGDMITRNLYVKACRAFPDAEVNTGHGMTEGGTGFFWPYGGKKGNRESEVAWYADISTLGKVQRGTRLRIVDEDGRPVKRGEVGELHYNNVSYIRHYLDNVKPEDFYEDEYGHWFKTGDTGIINEEGLVWILGRKKDIVKRAGVTINPAALESCLDSFLESQVRLSRSSSSHHQPL